MTGLVLAAGGPAHEYGPGPGATPHSPLSPTEPAAPPPGGMFKPFAWPLGLTEEQTRQVDNILEGAKPDAVAADKAVTEAQGILHQAVITGAADEQIQAAAKTLGEALSKQAVLHAKMLTAAKAVLTADQREQLDQIQARQSHSAQGTRGPNDGRWTVPHRQGASNTMASGPAHQVVSDGPAPREHMSVDQVFKAADTNQDGVLTQQEFQGLHDTMKAARQ
jgi:Spy/CpxP family protein refolding chaperone